MPCSDCTDEALCDRTGLCQAFAKTQLPERCRHAVRWERVCLRCVGESSGATEYASWFPIAHGVTGCSVHGATRTPGCRDCRLLIDAEIAAGVPVVQPAATKVCPECGGEGICHRTQALDDCTACAGTGRVPAGVLASEGEQQHE